MLRYSLKRLLSLAISLIIASLVIFLVIESRQVILPPSCLGSMRKRHAERAPRD
jgi:hypothetical protein